jgi:hypothetical protein
VEVVTVDCGAGAREAELVALIWLLPSAFIFSFPPFSFSFSFRGRQAAGLGGDLFSFLILFFFFVCRSAAFF